MKTNAEHNETYLADWLSGNISDEQLQQLVSANDFAAYQKLKTSFDVLEVNQPDMQQNFAAIRQKLSAKIKPRKVVPLFRYATIAATIGLLFGIYQIFFRYDRAETSYGETSVVNLADGSKVILNAQSSICYPSEFKNNRTMELEGEAFFQVEKGSTFTVETKDCIVEVLGTKFSVTATADYFQVICYEGRVKVSANGQESILKAADAIRVIEGNGEKFTMPTPQPEWLTGESSFKNAPLFHVFQSIGSQHDVDIDYPKSFKNDRFTGTVPNDDLEKSLQMICTAMNLQYRQDGRKIAISE